VALGAVVAQLPLVLVSVAINAGELARAVDPPGVAANAIVLDLRLPMESDEREPGI
jgi:hypothetical protein